MDSSDIDKLQMDLNRLGEWTVENEMTINPGKSKAVSFTKTRMKERIRYYFGDRLIPEASSFNLLKTERNLLYIRNQSIPRSKRFPSWL